MMTRMLTLACLAILIWGTVPGDAKAAITLGFDMDLSDTPDANDPSASVQGTRLAAPGEEFFIDVLVNLSSDGNPTTMVGLFSFDVTYVPAHVEVLSFTITPDGGTDVRNRPAGFAQDPSLPPQSVDAFTFGSFNAEPNFAVTNAPNLFSVGTLQIRTINTTGATTVGTLLGFANLTGSVADATSSSIASTLVVTAVPEPSTVWVCAAIVGLGRISRRRRVISKR